MFVCMQCRGVSPLLLEREVAEPRTDVRSAAEQHLFTRNGQSGLPIDLVRDCLAEAARSVASDAVSELTFGVSFLPFAPDESWVVDRRRGVSAGDTSRPRAVIRPRFDRWSFTATLQFDEMRIDPVSVRALVDLAGSQVGLGAYSPADRGWFGRFRVTEWTELPHDVAVAAAS